MSTVAELTSGGFREVLPDAGAIDPEHLLAACEARQANHVSLVRIEQLYPFAESDTNNALLRYPLTAEAVWAQEEPRNMGAVARKRESGDRIGRCRIGR